MKTFLFYFCIVLIVVVTATWFPFGEPINRNATDDLLKDGPIPVQYDFPDVLDTPKLYMTNAEKHYKDLQ